MYKQGGQNFNYGQDADTENNLFDKKAVGNYGIGGVNHTLGKKEPGNHSGYKPEYKRKTVYRFHLECYLKHREQNQDSDAGLNKCPDKC